MKRFVLFSTVFAASVLSLAPMAVSQSGEPTQQTDKSEEDWRKSQRKSGSSDREDPLSIPRDIGLGGALPPLDPIDQLPEESRRHLSKQRARAIAMMGPDGKVQDASYKPSEEAKIDPDLAADEEAVWNEMVEELSGSGSGQDDGSRAGVQEDGDEVQSDDTSNQGDASSQGQGGNASGETAGGDNAGSNDSSASAAAQSVNSMMRGGSAASASDILAQMRGNKTGPQSGQHGAPVPAQNGAQRAGENNSPTSENQKQSSAQNSQTSQAGGFPGKTDNSSSSSASPSGTDSETASGAGENEELGDAADRESTGAAAAGEQNQSDHSSSSIAPPSPLLMPGGIGHQVGASGGSSSASDYLKSQTETAGDANRN